MPCCAACPPAPSADAPPPRATHTNTDSATACSHAHHRRNALLRGMPTGAIGRRTAAAGYSHKYGFRYSVLTRPPSAG
nr:hypothetical protein [Mycobacterium nebraskense]